MFDLMTLEKNSELAGSLTLSMKGNDLLKFAHELADLMKKQPPPPTLEPEYLLTVDEASEYLKVSRVTLWNWQKKKILEPLKIGNMIRYRKSDILKVLEARTKA